MQARWYRRTAEQGHAEAQNNLAFLYANGTGVPEDLVTAYMWFLLAAEGGCVRAVNALEAFRDRLDPEEKAEARRRARERGWENAE
ncbi:MAG: tetratricopeptide repeat protein [Thiohalospira sp.]